MTTGASLDERHARRLPADEICSQHGDRLLTAIRQNERQYLAVHAVLGPNTQEPDTVRLRQLLRISLWHRQEWKAAEGDPRGRPGRRFNLEICPCWGEDFMSAFTEQQLTELWMKM